MRHDTIDRSIENQNEINTQEYQLLHQKAIIEALIFSSPEPISPKEIAEAAGLASGSIDKIVDELNADYSGSGRSFRIEEIGNGYKMFTLPDYHSYICRAGNKEKKLSLSNAALETLAIIAYKQPVTKIEIERIRGVDCDGVLRNLMARELVRIDGRAVSPGKPLLYTTSEFFLEFFGLSSIDNLPPLPSAEEPIEKLPSLKLIRPAEVSSESDEILLENVDELYGSVDSELSTGADIEDEALQIAGTAEQTEFKE
jgi:segregation and condensation protein B